MAINYRQELVGVFGYPVDENPSVVIQDAAFKAAGLAWHYLTLMVKPEGLGDAMRAIRAMNLQGINLTIPHKIACMAYLDDIDQSAQLIGAVNTVKNDHGRLIGYNTDGQGFVRAAMEEGAALSGSVIALLGAGGAAQAIAVESALAGAKKIYVINRDEARGRSLTDRINIATDCKAAYIRWLGTAEIPSDADILVNATSVGLYPDDSLPDVDMSGVHPGLTVCDVIPNPPDTPFLQEARQHGAARTITGQGMLVHQGAIGFAIWTGQEAPLGAMKQAIKQAFSK